MTTPRSRVSSGERVLCALEVGRIRSEPSEDAEQVTQALRGEPLTVVERAGEWARVVTAYDYPGWIRAEALASADDRHDAVADAEDAIAFQARRPVEEARAYLGAPYEWGGMTERGIDCSGLVHMAYRRAGRLVPRDAHEQEATGEPVDERDLRPGDLACYGEERADHIAFWLGGARILHATAREGAGGVVEEEEPEYLRARRRRFVRL